MAIKRFKVLFDGTTAGTGDWYELDTRYEDDSTRVLQIELTASDTAIIQGTTKDVKGPDKSFLDTLAPDEITNIVTVSADGFYNLTGAWRYIRVQKTGTAGNVKVQGMI
jgi:type 1 fimbria pilin